MSPWGAPGSGPETISRLRVLPRTGALRFRGAFQLTPFSDTCLVSWTAAHSASMLPDLLDSSLA
eukprot:2014997-Alexandrium_andersonii.AAC.1